MSSQQKPNGALRAKCRTCGAGLSHVGNRRLRFVLTRRMAADVGTTEAFLSEADYDLDRRALQGSSEQKRTVGDRDRTAGDNDQVATDNGDESSTYGQALAYRELEHGRDSQAHEYSELARRRTAAERLVTFRLLRSTAIDRSEIALDRDQITDDHNRLRHFTKTVEEAGGLSMHAVGGNSRRDRSDRAAVDRARAAHDRAIAAEERQQAVQEREHAARLRAAAAHDRIVAQNDRRLAGVDELTGVNLRSIGLTEIRREIERGHRTRAPLTLAFVDVNDLKSINDREGHLAGDALLRKVAITLRLRLRPYDTIVRFGGDEFICALPNIATESARQRFAGILAALESAGLKNPFSFGLAQLEEGDDLERLLRRADTALIRERRTSRHDFGTGDAA